VNAKIGWNAFCRILRQIEDQYTWARTGIPPVGYEDEDEDDKILEGLGDNSENEEGNEYLFSEIFYEDYLDFPRVCEHIEDGRGRAFGRNRLLGHIWAAAQCELLTYRRQTEGDEWISDRISVHSLLESLDWGNAASMPFVEKNLMKNYCACGWFKGRSWDCARRGQVCTSYFSNLDVWNRTTFLDDSIFE
jgi:hypothetical protein